MAYSVHAILLSASLEKRECTTKNKSRLIEFLQVCFAEDEVELEVSSESNDISVYGFMSPTIVTLERDVHGDKVSEKKEKT